MCVTSVSSSTLLVGQRMMYGKSSLNADVLEDESESALWRWEVSWVLLYKLVLFWLYCFVFFIEKWNLLNAYADRRSEIYAWESSQLLSTVRMHCSTVSTSWQVNASLCHQVDGEEWGSNQISRLLKRSSVGSLALVRCTARCECCPFFSGLCDYGDSSIGCNNYHTAWKL